MVTWNVELAVWYFESFEATMLVTVTAPDYASAGSTAIGTALQYLAPGVEVSVNNVNRA